VRFGDVVREVNAAEKNPFAAGLDRYVGLEHLEPEDLRVRSWGNVADGTTFTRVFRSGQVLFGKRRVYQRKAAVPDFDGICSGDILVFEAKPAVAGKVSLLPKLLPFVVQTDGFVNHAKATSGGSLSPRTKFKELAKYRFALPSSSAEQERIAALLKEADNTSGGYDLVRSAAEKAADAFVSEYVLAANAESGTTTLGGDAEIAYGLTVNAERRDLEDESPYLRVANVQRNALDLTEVKFIGATADDVSSSLLHEHDVLVVEGHADPTEIGRAALWRSEIEGCLHQNHILRIRCGDAWLAEFVLMYLNSADGRRYFRRHAKSSSGLYTINSAVLRNIRLPKLDVASQAALVERFRVIEARRLETATHIERLVALKKRLLTHLLTPPQTEP
jgi:restriction endonuclease S subunit